MGPGHCLEFLLDLYETSLSRCSNEENLRSGKTNLRLQRLQNTNHTC